MEHLTYNKMVAWALEIGITLERTKDGRILITKDEVNGGVNTLDEARCFLIGYECGIKK